MTNSNKHTETSSPHQAICYHDGECPLCQREIKLMKKVDKHSTIRWVDITKDTVALQEAGISYQQAMDRIHVIDTNQKLQTGVRGFIALWENLPYYRRIVPFARLPVVLPILEMGYRLFARYRLVITGRKNHDQHPS